MRRAWAGLGLRARLAASIGAVLVLAFAVVFVAVRIQMSHESSVIQREEARETAAPGAGGEERGSSISPIADAQSDVEKTFLVVGAGALVAALLAGYLVAARAAAPLRRYAATAARIDAGDLTPRLQVDPASPVELRTLAVAFNHMLDRLDRAFARQREFVSDASHELRSPLTAIRGQLEVLARSERPDQGEIERVAGVTMAELGRVDRLVEDMLSLARLDEGQRVARRRLDAAELLRELAGGAPGASLAGELPAGVIEADPDLVAQVVRNLLANARRHAGPDGRVAISAAARDGSLVVSVDDDGPGIAPAERERVFDRFHRSEPARDRGSGGSGLGLAIARSIVELHGGRIWAADSPLGGARVSFELPGLRPPTMRDLSPNA